MEMENNQRPTLLLVLLIVGIVTTILHYTDNFLFFDNYPVPTWITKPSVYVAWLILTSFGIAGYWLYKQRLFWIAYVCLCVYSITGVSSLGHYFYGSLTNFSVKMNTLIWLDAISGTALLSFTLWSGLVLKEWQKA
jgi:hypothetical protein